MWSDVRYVMGGEVCVLLYTHTWYYSVHVLYYYVHNPIRSDNNKHFLDL